MCFFKNLLKVFQCTAKREMLLTDALAPAAVANQNQAGVDNIPQAMAANADDDDMDLGPHDISTSDFIILQSSFECKSFEPMSEGRFGRLAGFHLSTSRDWVLLK